MPRRRVTLLVLAVLATGVWGSTGAAGTAACTWRREALDVPPYSMYAIDASSRTAWAVGGSSGSPPEFRNQPAIERWTDSGWERVRAPVFRRHSAGLRGVTIVSPDDAWAAGDRTRRGRTYQIYLHWDGERWRKYPAPRHDLGEVTDIDAVAADDVWAVGSDLFTRHGHTQRAIRVWHFDGVGWTPVDVPRAYGYLSSIDADRGRVTAVGTEDFGIPLVLEFDGTKWRRAELPSLPAQTNLFDIDGRWAVGVTTSDDSPEVPLALERIAGVWERATVPDLDWASLDTVSAVAPDDVWAFGRTDTSQGEPEPHFVWSVLHHDGSAWSVVSDPSSPDGATGDPRGSAAVGSTGEVWAIGQLVGAGGRVLNRTVRGC